MPVPTAGSSVTTPGVGKTQRLAKTVDEQVVNQAHLGADDLHRGVVSPGFLAQIGIVGGEKIFVEVEPRILGANEGG